jgi:hypothetical protein
LTLPIHDDDKPNNRVSGSRLASILSRYGRDVIQCESLSLPIASQWTITELKLLTPYCHNLTYLNAIQPQLEVTPTQLLEWLGTISGEKKQQYSLQHLSVDASFASAPQFVDLLQSLTNLTSLIIDKSNHSLSSDTAHACLDILVRSCKSLRKLVLPGLLIEDSLRIEMGSLSSQLYEIDLTGASRQTRESATMLAASLPFLLPSFINIRTLILPGLPTLPSVVSTALVSALTRFPHLTSLTISSPLEFSLPSLPTLVSLSIRGDCSLSRLASMPLLQSFESGELDVSGCSDGKSLLSVISRRYPLLRTLLCEGVIPSESTSILTYVDGNDTSLPILPLLHTINLPATTPVSSSWFSAFLRCLPSLSTFFCQLLLTNDTDPAVSSLPLTMCPRLMKYNLFLGVDGAEDDEIDTAIDEAKKATALASGASSVNDEAALAMELFGRSSAASRKVDTKQSSSTSKNGNHWRDSLKWNSNPTTTSSTSTATVMPNSYPLMESMSIEALMGMTLGRPSWHRVLQSIFNNNEYPSLQMIQTGDLPLTSSIIGLIIARTPNVHHIRIAASITEPLLPILRCITSSSSICQSLHALFITQFGTSSYVHDITSTRSATMITELAFACRNIRVLNIQRVAPPGERFINKDSIPLTVSSLDDIGIEALTTCCPSLWHLTIDHATVSSSSMALLLRSLPHLIGIELAHWRIPPSSSAITTSTTVSSDIPSPWAELIAARRGLAINGDTPLELELKLAGQQLDEALFEDVVGPALADARINLSI